MVVEFFLFFPFRLLVAEHERLEVLLEYYHEKLKEKFLSLAENRDSTLKSDKIKAKSFEDLQQRYQQLQAAARKLYKVRVIRSVPFVHLTGLGIMIREGGGAHS